MFTMDQENSNCRDQTDRPTDLTVQNIATTEFAVDLLVVNENGTKFDVNKITDGVGEMQDKAGIIDATEDLLN